MAGRNQQAQTFNIPKSRTPWEEFEDVNLIRGVLKYGVSWKKIFNAYDFKPEHNQNMALRDRFRNRFPLIYTKLYSQDEPEDEKRAFIYELRNVMEETDYDLNAHPSTRSAGPRGRVAQRRERGAANAAPTTRSAAAAGNAATSSAAPVAAADDDDEEEEEEEATRTAARAKASPKGKSRAVIKAPGKKSTTNRAVRSRK